MAGFNKVLGLHFKINACNLQCSYCYIVKNNNRMTDIPFSKEQIQKAFSRKRLGGACLINICSDAETLIHPRMPEIIETFLNEGHYVMIVTNGTLKSAINKLVNMEGSERLFFKISFHYEEMKKRNMLDVFFENIDTIRNSKSSVSLEYTTSDELSDDEIQEMKELCIQKLHGALPQINIPRVNHSHLKGVLSKNSFANYVEKWSKTGFDSKFFDFKKQIIGKKYCDYCYAGERALWINMGDGTARQCYHTKDLFNFMEDCDKPIKWLAVGNHCPEPYCYDAHFFMTLGVTPFPEYCQYRPKHDEIRNRTCFDGVEWVKPLWKKQFNAGVVSKEHSPIVKNIVNGLNTMFVWNGRKKDEMK